MTTIQFKKQLICLLIVVIASRGNELIILINCLIYLFGGSFCFSMNSIIAFERNYLYEMLLMMDNKLPYFMNLARANPNY